MNGPAVIPSARPKSKKSISALKNRWMPQKLRHILLFMKTIPSKTEMSRAFLERDASYDALLFAAVRTTGVFCRPSCPAKKPRIENVQFYSSARDALFAGFRPSKRCRPMASNGRPPAWVARLLTIVERDPAARLTDQDLRASSIEPTRARRYFKEHYGMTFQAYQRARRMGDALGRIRDGKGLTDVALGHGYESDSGFRHAFGKIFGKTPGRSRRVSCIVAKMIESPVGPLILGATEDALCLLEFADRRAIESQIVDLRKRFKCAVLPGNNPHLLQATRELASYFAGKLSRFEVELVIRGTPFQELVWRRLLKIPYGKTLSYAALAEAVGRAGAQRAVGTANGRNRIAIIIPCHRVVNRDGRLGGYGGGLWRKQFLLDLERGERP